MNWCSFDPLCDLLRPERERNGNKPDASKTLAVRDPLIRYFSVSGVRGIYETAEITAPQLFSIWVAEIGHDDLKIVVYMTGIIINVKQGILVTAP